MTARGDGAQPVKPVLSANAAEAKPKVTPPGPTTTSKSTTVQPTAYAQPAGHDPVDLPQGRGRQFALGCGSAARPGSGNWRRAKQSGDGEARNLVNVTVDRDGKTHVRSDEA